MLAIPKTERFHDKISPNAHAEFQRWRRDHRDGYFLNLRTRSKALLHRVTCAHPGGTTWQPENDNGATLTRRKKVCATNVKALRRWAEQAGVEVALCRDCHPRDTARDPPAKPPSQEHPPRKTQPPGIVPGGTRLKRQQDDDVEFLAEAKVVTLRKVHNRMTNAVERYCEKFGLVVEQGVDPTCRFDALIQNYCGTGRDLLIEVKAGTARSFCRMAVGQLLDYRRLLDNPTRTDMAVLFPHKPDSATLNYLKDVNVRVLWLAARNSRIEGLVAQIRRR